MSNIFIINGHQPYPFAKGDLNAAFVNQAQEHFKAAGYDVRLTEVAKGYDVEREVANHQWANNVIMQFPVNWMGVPWSFKKYLDEVYTAGMDGRLTDGDGRTAENPNDNYGTGGSLTDTRYMLSVTFNAPKESFDDPSQWFFAGRSVDDLMLPMHLNAKFFGMKQLPTFAAFDVMKNPDVGDDFERFKKHLGHVFPIPVEA